jgi:hypothetical protein
MWSAFSSDVVVRRQRCLLTCGCCGLYLIVRGPRVLPPLSTSNQRSYSLISSTLNVDLLVQPILLSVKMSDVPPRHDPVAGAPSGVPSVAQHHNAESDDFVGVPVYRVMD